jgi:hypothetical protein
VPDQQQLRQQLGQWRELIGRAQLDLVRVVDREHAMAQLPEARLGDDRHRPSLHPLAIAMAAASQLEFRAGAGLVLGRIH